MEDRDSGLLTLPDELGVAFDGIIPSGASRGVLVLRYSSKRERDGFVYIHNTQVNSVSKL